jgi:hypothetical protein
MARKLILLLLASLLATTLASSGGGHKASNGTGHDGIHLASWNWTGVGSYLTVTIFVILSGLAKVGFHHLHWLSSRVPESW